MTNEDLIRDLDLAPVEGFDGYFVDIYGNVYSSKRSRGSERTLRKRAPSENGHGYFQVMLFADGKPYPKKVHRLVAEAFVPNPEHLPQVNHIDGNRKNNFVGNLEWCTNQENTLHSYRTLHRKLPRAKTIKLTDKETGETFSFRSQTECAHYLHMSQNYLSCLLTGTRNINNWSLNTRYSVEFDETDE